MGWGGKKKKWGYPYHPGYFKQKMSLHVHLAPDVHRKVQNDNVMKNSRVSGQLALNGVLVR